MYSMWAELVAAFQPEIRAMPYYEMPGHPFGVDPVVTNYKRGAELTVHIARLLFFTVALYFYDDTTLLGFSWERCGAQFCYRQLQKVLAVSEEIAAHGFQDCLHLRRSQGHKPVVPGRFVFST